MRFLTIQETPNDQVMRAEVLQAELGVTHCVVGGEDSDVGGAREGVGVFGQLRDIREAGLDVLCAPPDGAQRAVLEVKTRLHRLHKVSSDPRLSNRTLPHCLALLGHYGPRPPIPCIPKALNSSPTILQHLHGVQSLHSPRLSDRGFRLNGLLNGTDTSSQSDQQQKANQGASQHTHVPVCSSAGDQALAHGRLNLHLFSIHCLVGCSIIPCRRAVPAQGAQEVYEHCRWVQCCVVCITYENEHCHAFSHFHVDAAPLQVDAWEGSD